MKRILSARSHYFRPVVIFLDQLKEIYELLQRHQASIDIECDGFSYADFQELVERKIKRANNLRFHTTRPYLTIEFGSRSAARLYLDDHDIAAVGLYTDIK